jgi:hypothetical protein
VDTTPRRTPVTVLAPAPAAAPAPATTMPAPAPMQPITLPNGQTVQIPDFDMSRTVPQPTMPSIPSLPKLGSRPSLRRMPMMDDPRER